MTKTRRVLTSPLRGVKALYTMAFSRSSSWHWYGAPRLGRGYQHEVGDGTASSTVMAPLLWIARTFPEAPPALWQRTSEAGQEDDRVVDHPLLRLLDEPNGFYGGRQLWMATLTDWSVDGNAYWLKIRDRAGTVRQLWWAPAWMVCPYGDDTTFVRYYEYMPGGTAAPIRVDPADIVHFRFGLDADNARKGYSPLKSVLAEVFTDDEAARFTASLLRNMGVPGLVISPDNDLPLDPGDAAATKAYISSNFTGDRRGEPLVMSGRTKVQQFGFSPEQLMLRELRRIPEERVSAVLGVPAIVAGLGAGLDRSTFTNMGEAREMAYESNIIPTQRILADDIRRQLLSEWETDPFMWRFGFDLSEVRTLQGDEDARWRRYDVGVRGGWVTRAAAKRATGQQVLAGDEVYLIPANYTQVPADGSDPAAADATANGNGNGGANSAEIAQEVVRQMTAATS